jgi:hypothetical protein
MVINPILIGGELIMNQPGPGKQVSNINVDRTKNKISQMVGMESEKGGGIMEKEVEDDGEAE